MQDEVGDSVAKVEDDVTYFSHIGGGGLDLIQW
jgi:hypothetical protein